MKISPVASGTGSPGAQLGSVEVSGRTATPQKLERARAIARGDTPTEQAPAAAPQQAAERANTRRIQMRTNFSTDRDLQAALEAAGTPEGEKPSPETESSTLNPSEQGTVEATQPLSPHLAALARQKQALRQERAQFEKEKAEFKKPQDGEYVSVADLKSNALRVLQQHEALTPDFYNSAAELLMNGQQPGFNPEIQALKAEIKALKEGVDKNFVDRDSQQEQAALAEMKKEAERISREGETYELVRETNSVPKVMDLIHRTYKETGEVLDVSEAMQLVEDEIFADAQKLAALKKVQAKLAPPAAEPLQPQQRQMRTLTARDTAAPTSDRRQRAIMAAMGTLKR